MPAYTASFPMKISLEVFGRIPAKDEEEVWDSISETEISMALDKLIKYTPEPFLIGNKEIRRYSTQIIKKGKILHDVEVKDFRIEENPSDDVRCSESDTPGFYDFNFTMELQFTAEVSGFRARNEESAEDKAVDFELPDYLFKEIEVHLPDNLITVGDATDIGVRLVPGVERNDYAYDGIDDVTFLEE
ncbi:MAG: hypothetical protein WCJ64_00960 [Rhodospirillaceae bacterium]